MNHHIYNKKTRIKNKNPFANLLLEPWENNDSETKETLDMMENHIFDQKES